MESSNRNNDFQTQLKQINFKTFYHGQVETFGYDDLFADRRVLVFAITQMRYYPSYVQFMSFAKAADQLKSLGIDDVCAINSFENLFGIWADHQSQNIKALPNIDGSFVRALAQYQGVDKPEKDLKTVWQYITIINNGVPEKVWHNPFKAGMMLRAIKTEAYQYRNLSVDKVVEYLTTTVDKV